MLTYPLFNCAGLAQGSFCSGDTVGDTAVTFAKAPELSTHFLGKKAKASWSEYINSQRGIFFYSRPAYCGGLVSPPDFLWDRMKLLRFCIETRCLGGAYWKGQPPFNSQLAVLATCWSVTYLIEHFRKKFFAIHNLPTGEVWWYLLVKCSTLFNLKCN